MTNSDAELKALKDMVSRFAREEVAPRGDLQNLIVFPPDLHEAMEKQSLFGIGVPRASGGALARPPSACPPTCRRWRHLCRSCPAWGAGSARSSS